MMWRKTWHWVKTKVLHLFRDESKYLLYPTYFSLIYSRLTLGVHWGTGVLTLKNDLRNDLSLPLFSGKMPCRSFSKEMVSHIETGQKIDIVLGVWSSDVIGLCLHWFHYGLPCWLIFAYHKIRRKKFLPQGDFRGDFHPPKKYTRNWGRFAPLKEFLSFSGISAAPTYEWRFHDVPWVLSKDCWASDWSFKNPPSAATTLTIVVLHGQTC